MTVHTLDEHRFAVDQQLGILNLHLAETDALGDTLNKFVTIIKRYIEFVEVGGLSRPFERVGFLDDGLAFSVGSDFQV